MIDREEIINIVIKAYTSSIEDITEGKINVDSDTKIDREDGMDSLAFAEFVIGMEEELDTELDDYLLEIKKAITIGNVVQIIEKALGGCGNE